MYRLIVLLVVVAAGLRGEEVASKEFGFRVTFPDSPNWTAPVHKVQFPTGHIWAASNLSAGESLVASATHAPRREPPSLKDEEEPVEQALLSRGYEILSSHYGELAGHPACRVIATLKDENRELFTSIWLVPLDEGLISLTFTARSKVELSGDAASSFFSSLKISRGP